MNQENVYNITSYNLFDFLKEVQNAVQQGFVLSDKNQYFPQAYISLYTVTLIKKDKPEEVVEIATVVAEETTQVDTSPVKEVTIKDIVTNQDKKTTGRKPKAK